MIFRVTAQSDMSKPSGKTYIDWSRQEGASLKPKRLHLEEEEGDGLFHCPVVKCAHEEGFSTQRGCRKHVKTKHAWFYFFDSEPSTSKRAEQTQPRLEKKYQCLTKSVASFDVQSTIGKQFEKWLTGSGGGCKSERQAQQIVKRSFKYLKFCCEDDEDEGLYWDVVDYSLSSPNFLFKFVDAMQTDWGLGHSGRIAYLDSISDLIDFRKVIGVASETVLRNLTSSEVYLKRARKTISRMMRLQWTSDLDIDTLESKGHWASLDELLHVVTYHLPRYETVSKLCKENPNKTTTSDLSFATKFVAVYLFIKVKGSRPMTYQYLTVDMVKSAHEDDGFIDQKKFKTTAKYGFDSFYLPPTGLQVLDTYIEHVRPLLKPTCEYVLVTLKGQQHNRIGQLMSKLVFEATGKYIHPTRYRQIVETASHQQLTSSEQESISEDQKHSSVVAKVHYQKRRSRDVAAKGHECLKKLQGEQGCRLDEDVRSRLSNRSNDSPEKKMPNALPTNAASAQLSKKKALLFTPEEDEYLRHGIRRHGHGKWVAILRDPSYKFKPGRTPNSLLYRASKKGFAKSN